METFDCPKCGAPVNYEPNALGGGPARCAYCQSQLALPSGGRPAQIVSQIDINISPQVTASAKKWIWFLVLVPMIILMIVLAGVFGVLAPVFRSIPKTAGGPGGSADAGKGFAQPLLKFGSEGIGPGMMHDARNIGVDGQGRIYVGEYLGGRVQVFDAGGNFITQWMVDAKMPMRALTADRNGTVYVVQRGAINRYEGTTGKPLGEMKFTEPGFDDAKTTPDGGLICAWYRGRDDIVRFDSSGNAAQTIPKAVSTVADASELDTRVALDGLGNIYALGTFTNSVFKFNRDGKFVNRFGGQGHEPGQISAGLSIAVDGKGRIFVSDSKGIQVFDSDGRYLTVFRPAGGVAFGMVFNDQNELLVAARTTVQKFRLQD